MNDSGNIIWLVSYPKSGNTWLRVFFANLISGKAEPVSINEIHNITIASNRNVFDDYSGIPSSDLTLEEIERLRPYVYEELSSHCSFPTFLKVHDAYTFTMENRPLFPEKAGGKAIYIIRNPLAVAVSFAHHLALTAEKTVQRMNNPEYKFCANTDTLHNQLEQKLLTWSQHVNSWTAQQNINTLVIRYEDMVNLPLETFKTAADFCGLNCTHEQLEIAIENSSFETLKSQEKNSGFKEKPGNAESFFRKGQAESWKEELDINLQERIMQNHSEVMKKYGYL